ncbi:arginine deiminase [Liquorilactobacillus capillatus]|uniref:Arginine deiminase n=1 Tax=Liquorilactobacillus capillatus DSM 19910 TaxID=1423731 RepID=A0A0R1MIC1_9LACO|nr:arginine deiminase [Liquorilactobacillus capillatus]KRL03576.1 arginine deiminase [Liquorilactobacillus capillatus DSM 19910]
MDLKIEIKSEIGKLKVVLLKQPGKEIENITPVTMHGLLFDDIPYLPEAQKEHEEFAAILRQNGTHVLYLDDLMTDILKNKTIKSNFLEEIITASGFADNLTHTALKTYLNSLEPRKMITELMAGIRKGLLGDELRNLRSFPEVDDNPFIMAPMPNLYFTRDLAAIIGKGASISKMTFRARQRETLFIEYILKQHPFFAQDKIPYWHQRNSQTRIEGGDVLVLNEHVVAVGISQRTSAEAIEALADKLFKNNSGYDTVIALKIPCNHAMMHLDTVFTMVNYDQFTVYPDIMQKNQEMDIWVLHPADAGIEYLKYSSLERVLKDTLQLDELDLIYTGAGDEIAAPREQWNDGSNTLTIAPGEVVTYNRNYISNDLLRKHGIKVHEISSSELSRGRGGPRCMSLPLLREKI